MNFVHIADMHLDAPFTTLADKQEVCKSRRLEQREILKNIVNYIKQHEIKYFFISGDLYEHSSIRQSTIDYINSLFLEIPNTKIFISPGNHDPYIKNSFYATYNWSKNVTIFKENIEKISLEDVNIYGYGFTDFYSNRVNFSKINLDKSKLNILIIHGSLDASDMAQMQYNPISSKELETIGFDYVALGHIHKRNCNIIEENKKIIYPGSTNSLGFDELGEHGMIVGELEKEKIKLQFIKVDPKIFIELKLDISEINSEDDLVQKINDLDTNENELYKLILTGKRKFEINLNEISKLVLNDKILKIKNLTNPDFDIENLVKQQNLVRNVCERNKRSNKK